MNLSGLLCGLLVCCNYCQAQDVGEQRVIARAGNLDVREAIRRLFKSVDFPYSIDSEIEGPISINLHGVTFEQAFQTILRQVNATYRVEGGIYQIILQDIPGQADVASFDPPRIDILKSDCRLVLAKIFGTFGYRAIIQPQVQGLISYAETPSSFDQLIQLLAGRVGATCRRMSGGFEVLKPPSSAPVFALVSDLPFSKPQSLKESDFEYQVIGDRLNKIDRVTQKPIASVELQRSINAVDLNLDSPSDRQALVELAKNADTNLSIAPEAKWKIRIDAGPATADHLTACLSRSLKIPLTSHEGINLILKPANNLVSLNLFDFDPIGENTYPLSSMKIAGALLQVECGRWRYLVQKDDLKIISWKSRLSP